MKYVNIEANTPTTQQEINAALLSFLAQGVQGIEVVATTRGAVSHCDASVQDEPMWQVRGELPSNNRTLLQQALDVFSNEE